MEEQENTEGKQNQKHRKRYKVTHSPFREKKKKEQHEKERQANIQVGK